MRILLFALAFVLAVAAAPSAEPTWEPREERTIELYNAGIEKLNEGSYAAAEHRFRKAVAREPSCGIVHLALGEILFLQDQTAEAAERLVALAERFPERPQVYISLSRAAFAAQQFEQARDAGLRAVALQPHLLEAHRVLLAALVRIGDYAAAQEAVERARQELAHADAACLATRLAVEREQVEVAREALAACEQGGAPDLVSEARNQLAVLTGDASLVDDVANEFGAGSVTRRIHAYDLMESFRNREAEEVLTELLQDNPDDISARLLRATVRRNLGRDRAALRDLEAVFETDTWIRVEGASLTGVLTRRAELEFLDQVHRGAALLVTLHLEAGEMERARTVLERARSALEPGPRLALAEARIRRAEGDPTAAWQVMARALETWPGDRQLLQVASEWGVEDEAGMPESVREAASQAESWQTRYNVAVGHHNAERFQRCLETAESMVAAGTADEAGASLLELGYTCAARVEDLEALQAWWERYPDPAAAPAVVRYEHTRLLYQAGQKPAALEVFETLDLQRTDLPPSTADLGVVLLAETGHLDRAAALAARPEVSPQNRAWLAQRLEEAGRVVDARVLASDACAAMEGDSRDDCEQYLEYLESLEPTPEPPDPGDETGDGDGAGSE